MLRSARSLVDEEDLLKLGECDAYSEVLALIPRKCFGVALCLCIDLSILCRRGYRMRWKVGNALSCH